jgi:hypothetical protein
MLQNLKLKVVGLACVVASILVVVLALPAVPLGFLFWLICIVGAAIEDVGSLLLGLVDAYLEWLWITLNRISGVVTDIENQTKKWFRGGKFKGLAQPRRR